ncbi:MAG TPA: metallophosphoesterase family protein [Planctomycetota bacterium]|nr:metallophosphoesterase family protein [Planctomycetota bacterium]
MSSNPLRYGIIADIHSNLAALRAVLDALAGEDVGTILCMGDVVGYGPCPHEVIEALETAPLHSIRGNHDRYALGENSEQIRPSTAQAVEYTRRCLSPSDNAFLEGLRDTMLYQDRILLVHGSPREPDEYILNQEAAILNHRYLRSQYGGINLCFFGHSHLPTIVGDGKVVYEIDSGYTLKLKFMVPYLINPGSVGQPRDGNPAAAYAVLDTAEKTVTFRRVAYDVEDTQRRIQEAGLPRYLGERLRVGK